MFEIGEKVRIKDNFTDINFHDDPGLDPDMYQYAGQVVTVKDTALSNKHWFKVEENRWTWDIRWVEIVEEEINFTPNDWEKVFE